MDLIEIRDGYLAENRDHLYFGHWFVEEWVNRFYSYYHPGESNVPIANTSFTVGESLVELSDGFFLQDPLTELDPNIGGHLITLSMVSNIAVKDAKLEGKMCIRHPTKCPIFTKYELNLKNADMVQHIGLVIYGDELIVNSCKYDFPVFDISFVYRDNSETKSLFDQETDTTKRHLLQRFLVEYITTDLCDMLYRFAKRVLCNTRRFVSILCGRSIEIRNDLRSHNRISHKAFKNLAIQILNLTIELVKRSSTKLHLPRIYGVTEDRNFKLYTCYINNLNILGYEQAEHSCKLPHEVIITYEGDCVIIHVPVRFWELAVHYSEIKEDQADSELQFKNKVVFRTGEAHFILSLKKNDQNKVEFKLIKFKIVNFRPIGTHPILMTMDHLVTSAIENYLESVIKKTFEDKKLQELATVQEVELEDETEDLSDSLDEEVGEE